MAHGRQHTRGGREPEDVNGVPIYDRPEMQNVSMFEGEVAPRKPNPLAVAVLALGAVIVSVGFVWLLALGITKLTSGGTGEPKLNFAPGKHYALLLRKFEGDEAKLDAERLKLSLEKAGNATVGMYGVEGKNVAVVTVGHFAKGQEAEARLLYKKFIQTYPDARFVEVP